ncbi:sulfurtransferase complex subunit TusB [Endozoicomonas sp.]|uniref:sulfurtransferase complex subunit TusB n=1 Tax=Endozoicomonas sp. TaxID=1892382 RepID=UPI00383BE6B0
MKTLHTVNKPGQPMALCIRAVADGDSVLLIEDGVYELLSSGKTIDTLPDNCSLLVLDVDARARGVSVPEHIKAIGYDDFVTLSVDHDKVLSWF